MCLTPCLYWRMVWVYGIVDAYNTVPYMYSAYDKKIEDTVKWTIYQSSIHSLMRLNVPQYLFTRNMSHHEVGSIGSGQYSAFVMMVMNFIKDIWKHYTP